MASLGELERKALVEIRRHGESNVARVCSAFGRKLRLHDNNDDP